MRTTRSACSHTTRLTYRDSTRSFDMKVRYRKNASRNFVLLTEPHSEMETKRGVSFPLPLPSSKAHTFDLSWLHAT